MLSYLGRLLTAGSALRSADVRQGDTIVLVDDSDVQRKKQNKDPNYSHNGMSVRELQDSMKLQQDNMASEMKLAWKGNNSILSA